ncbi:hypothetical protein ACFLZ8_01315 [Planctomycetota bacterium]
MPGDGEYWGGRYHEIGLESNTHYIADIYVLGGISFIVNDPGTLYYFDSYNNWELGVWVTTIPTPGAIILGGIGVGLVSWLRRRRAI